MQLLEPQDVCARVVRSRHALPLNYVHSGTRVRVQVRRHLEGHQVAKRRDHTGPPTRATYDVRPFGLRKGLRVGDPCLLTTP